MVMIVLTVGSGIFMWTLAQNTSYNETVRQSNLESIDRSNENVLATNGTYSVSGDEVVVEVLLRNIGPVAVSLKNLWIFDSSIEKSGFNNTIDLNCLRKKRLHHLANNFPFVKKRHALIFILNIHILMTC